ncbi:hypothetical protein BCR42DRAFT_428168 [Absidia repens]|uniref:Uncharacterized protein n=1 Tax=Absidia repens TaxID=90262 RepID=A0A1X2HYG1_9FUNG|nr:hypothetical protein BCR42DRAFT_428168 [Absidia repens]
MDHVPAEIISSIIEHIDEQNDLLSCSLVNQCFYKATIPFLWRFIVEGEHAMWDEDQEKVKFLDCLMQQPPHPMANYVQEIELFSQWTDTEFVQLMSLIGPQVESVYISSSEAMSDTSFQQLGCFWPNVTALYARRHSATQASMIALARQCPRLRILQLGYCPALSPRTLAPFVEAGCQLEEVALEAAGGGSHHVWNEQIIVHDLIQFPLLTSIWFDGSSPQVTEAILTTNEHAWPQLTTLRLENIGQQVGDDRRLIPFIQAHPRLTDITLTNTNMTDATVDAITTSLPDVRRVILCQNTHISANSIRRLVRRRGLNLSMVDFKGCNITLAHFPEACDNANNCDATYLHRGTIDKITAQNDSQEDIGLNDDDLS